MLQPQEVTLTDEQKVMKIAVAYIEENYGTDYVVKGEVTNRSFTEDGVWKYNYPTASFRIPADDFEAGQWIDVLVDPDTEEIVKVFTSIDRGLFPYDIKLSNCETQVRRGESTTINITLTLIYIKEATVSCSLDLDGYNNTPVGENYPFPFEVKFEPEQLLLNQQEPKTAILTLTADDDAPVGTYLTTVRATDGKKGIGSSLWIRVDNPSSGEQRVMKIAVAYIEENYGTDYAINGEVSNSSLKEGDVVYNYPTASFRIPSDWFEPGQLVNIMVDPDTEEIIKVYSTISTGLPPYEINLSNWEIEIGRGKSTTINITLTLIYTKEATVSCSLELGAYNNTPVGPNYPFPFEVVFEPEKLLLKQQEPEYVILTLVADEDAPFGLYTTFIGATDGDKGISASPRITVVE
jgi:hypothetical protein